MHCASLPGVEKWNSIIHIVVEQTVCPPVHSGAVVRKLGLHRGNLIRRVTLCMADVCSAPSCGFMIDQEIPMSRILKRTESPT